MSIPKLVQEKLLKVKSLEGKRIVASVLACPAYLMYLSDKGKGPIFFGSIACHLAEPSPGGEAFSVAFSPPSMEYEYV